VVALVVFSPTN